MFLIQASSRFKQYSEGIKDFPHEANRTTVAVYRRKYVLFGLHDKPTFRNDQYDLTSMRKLSCHLARNSILVIVMKKKRKPLSSPGRLR